MKAEAQLLKGHLDTLLLATLEAGPLHGYAVMEALRQAGGSRLDLPTGTIYPALRRLEAAGLLEGNRSGVGGRPPIRWRAAGGAGSAEPVPRGGTSPRQYPRSWRPPHARRPNKRLPRRPASQAACGPRR